VLFALVMMVCAISMGLYKRSFREGVSGMLVRIAISFVFALLLMSAVFYTLPGLFLGRGVLGLAFVFSLVGVTVTRGLFFAVFDQNAFKRRVLVLGAGKRAATLGQLRRRVDQRGFMVVGFVHIHGEHDAVDRDRILDDDGDLVSLAERHEIDEIVVAMDDRRRGFPVHELLDCKMRGIEVLDIQTFFERETGKLRLDCMHPSWMIFSDGFGQSPLQDYVKRSFDIVTSLALLTATLPIMFITILAIKIEDGGPVFFRQVRVGQGGKHFEVIKFRSMRVDAESDGKARWAAKNDSRVTRVGAVIRKFRIDELPQVINVLKGEMSFVGPRPERPEFVEKLSATIPYFAERHRVKPGITGWAQIRYQYGSSEKDALEKLQYDLYYAKNHNVFLDLTILLQTAEVIMFGQGAR
jgi:sugar transferase (PEP-CTERM system associated)